MGDGRACYGHLLHEVQKASQTSMLLRLRVSFAMLGVCPCHLPAAPPLTASILGGLWRCLVSLPKSCRSRHAWGA